MFNNKYLFNHRTESTFVKIWMNREIKEAIKK